VQNQTHSAEQHVDPEGATIQSDESPETPLDRTRHLLARSRLTLAAATGKLNTWEDEREWSQRRDGDQLSEGGGSTRIPGLID
jgi:hypothetical protein